MIGVSAFLFTRIQQQGEVIASLQSEIRALQEERGAVVAAAAQAELMAALRSLDVAPASEVELCHLAPVGDAPLQPMARARLFLLDEKEGRWYLRAQNLDRAPEGQFYILWFLSKGEPVDRRMLGEEVREAISDRLPPEMDSVVLTLETSPNPDRPTGPEVLFGREADMVTL
jgi:hypothetical protein